MHYGGYGAYGAVAQVREINSINDIMITNYSFYNSDFSKECLKFFKQLEEKNEHLTPKQIDDFVKKIIKGKSKSLIGRYGTNNIEVLNALTKNHLLTDKQINNIISCWIPKTFVLTFKWIDNLILQQYIPTDKTRNTLIELGYTAGIDIILNKNESDINEFNAICNMSEINVDKIEAYMKKFKIIPTLESVDIIIAKLGAFQYQSNYTTYRYPNIKKEDPDLLLKVIQIFILYGFPPSLEFLIKISKYIHLEKISDYVDQLFKLVIIKNSEDIASLFSSNHHLITLNNIIYLLEMCKKYYIPVTVKILLPMITSTYKYKNDKVNNGFRKPILYPYNIVQKELDFSGLPGDENNKIILSQYLYRTHPHTGSLAELIEKYFNIITILLKNSTAENLELELLEQACLVSDQLLFDVLINKLNKFTNQCLINACKSGYTEMLHVFFNMKALASIECLQALPLGSKPLFDLLLANGLPVNLKTIEVALLQDLYIDNLYDNYGFQPDIELYKLCHRHSIYPQQYITQMTNIPEINMAIRNAIDYASTIEGAQVSIIKMIESQGIIPDSMMYDDAIENGADTLVAYFEKEWGMRLNLTSIMRINDFSKRMKYLEILAKKGVISDDILITTVVPKKVDVVNDTFTNVKKKSDLKAPSKKKKKIEKNEMLEIKETDEIIEQAETFEPVNQVELVPTKNKKKYNKGKVIVKGKKNKKQEPVDYT